MPDYKYDVFVSYSSANKKWVRETFIPILEKEGLICCDYYRDFEVGAPIVKEMERAVLESRKTILVLSPEYLESGWTEFENLMLQTLDAANQERRLLPVIHKQCKLPLRFSYMNCVNLDNPDDEKIEWQRLFKAIGKPISEDKAKKISSPEGDWHLKHRYALTGNFTGREAELKTLTDWLETKEEPLFILRALGGFGKSALAWHWLLNKVDRAKWTKAVWWSFYEGDASFQNFLDDTLKYLLSDDVELPSAPRLQVEMLLKALEEEGILLVLDGFERALRAYSSMSAAYQEDDAEKKYDERDLDCVSPAADDFLRGLASSKGILRAKILLTTRLRPRAVEVRGNLLNGCLEKELKKLSKADAVAFFQNQGVKGTRAEIEATCQPYGYHPLTLSILAGYILGNRQKPNDISVAKELNITKDIIQNKHHVLEVAYNSLSPEEANLLSTIACFRSPTSYEALKSITESPLPKGAPFGDDKGQGEGENLDDQLNQLETRGLLHWDKPTNKYDLHPIVRRYAYERLTAPDRTAAHTRLRDYFEAVPKPEKIESLNDLAPVIELYHHMVNSGQFDEARVLFRDRLQQAAHYQFGAYQLQIGLLQALFVDGEDEPPRLREKSAQPWTISALANCYSLNGEPGRAVPLYDKCNDLFEKMEDKSNLAGGLVASVKVAQIPMGMFRNVMDNLNYQVALSTEVQDEFREALGHQAIGRALTYQGVWADAEQELDLGLKLYEKHQLTQSQGIIYAYRSLHTLLLARDTGNIKLKTKHFQLAIKLARHALELAEEIARMQYPHPVNYILSYWMLGASYRVSKKLNKSEENLSKALRICREINNVMYEADILIEISKLRHAQGSLEETLRLAQEALIITERSGYVLQGADVNLWLAELALQGLKVEGLKVENKELAKEYAQKALQLAYCDDGPPYHYKVAYEEAQALLEKLKE